MYCAFPFSKGSLKRKMGVHLFLHMDFFVELINLSQKLFWQIF
jgi:hypothetical protein